jgi:hypothetical protein
MQVSVGFEIVSNRSDGSLPSMDAFTMYYLLPDNYARMTDARVNWTGIGAARAVDGAWYFTQIFVQSSWNPF